MCSLIIRLFILLGLILPATASASITEFSAGLNAAASPSIITSGPDGNLWFAENGGNTNNRIGRITPAGVVTEFSTGITAGAYPFGITSGPDGNLWFTEMGGSRIGRITPAGVVTEFSAGLTAAPYYITSGPDGNLWFTEPSGNRIGRITPAGVITEFSTGLTAGASPQGITSGPDGNLWFTEYSGNRIGRITPVGVITEFSAGITAAAGPYVITSGTDGNLWFTEMGANRIGRITTAGVVTEFSAGITASANLYVITSGPDGNLWFTESLGNRIGRITPAGVVTEFSTGITAGAYPFGITSGPDGNLWFAESASNRIGRITITLPSVPTVVTATAGIASAVVSFTPGTIGGGLLVNYTADCGAITGTGSSSPIAVNGLTNGIAYTCKVQATSDMGTGPWSALSNSVVPAPGSQSISFGIAPTLVVVGTGAVSATGGASGNPVTFTSITPNICTVSGSTITGVVAGTCTIAANQSGNASYNAAPQILQNLTIGLGNQTVSFGAVPVTTVGGTVVVSATATSGIAVNLSSTTPAVCTVFGNTVTAVSAGTCVIAANQTGNANYFPAAQVTQSFTIGNTLPIVVTPMVAAGNAHTVALKSDGTLAAWGWNAEGELGDGTNTQRHSPVVVSGLSGVMSVSAGAMHTVGLKTDGTVVAWGWNNLGELGDGTTINQLSPVAVLGLSGVVAVAAGGSEYSLALKSDGTVWAWGDNRNGLLGNGNLTKSLVPVAVPGLAGIVAVAAGGNHAAALKADGTVLVWGWNFYGQLGDGTVITRSTPVIVPGLSGVVSVSAGSVHTVALKSDGTVVTWGYNGNGQLGDGTTTNRSTPAAVSGLSGVVAVAAGDGQTVALKSDGTIVVWGVTSAVSIYGTGVATQNNRPVAISGLTGVTSIAAGKANNFTLALKSDGTIVAWGNNNYGQLGDGTTTQQLSPVAAMGLNLGVITPTTSLSPALPLLTFPAQNLNTNSVVQALTLTNTGSNPLYNPSILVNGDYISTTTCGVNLAVAASCTIGISFTPAGLNARNGNLTIVGNGAILNSVSLNGSGVGAVVSLGSTSLNFAAQNLGTTSATQTVTINNTGNLPLNFASIVASGDYAVTHNCGAGLGVGGFCTLNITFSPVVTGIRTGSITLTDDAFNSQQTISLSGTGVAVPVVSLNPMSVTFSTQTVGTSSTVQTIALTNTGGAALNLASITASGDFAVTHTCGAGLGAAGFCSLSVTFAPTVAGNRSGAIIITNNTAISPSTISLSGIGIAPALILNLTPSWNLLGNSVNAPLTVATTFGNAANVSTVWTWNPATSKWAFYAASMTAPALATYATSKGYDVLSTINGGEGFWVNAKAAFTVQLPAGTAINSSTFSDQLLPPNNLPTGWSLIAIGDNRTPRAFATAIYATNPAVGVVPPSLTTLWAWDSTLLNWYFYAPSLDNSGGLAAYLTTKGYLDFASKTLDPTMGFWVNHP